ncbi:MAG: branched-chain amino acid ABC transporter permease [Candidatus Dormiibacterota bacterium]
MFLLAAGLSVILGLMDVVNLAHGSLYMLGAYVGLTVLGLTHNFWLALVVAPIVVGLIGLVMELTLLRRFYGKGPLRQVLLTFGLALVFVDLVRWIFGPSIQSIAPPPQLAGATSILGSQASSYRLFVLGVAIVVGAVLLLLWRRTRVGTLVRAGVADKQMVSLLGVDLRLVFTLTFTFGAALAGFSGVIAGPYLSVYPGMDENILILTFVVVVIGGMGSIEGAIAGAVLVGLANSFGTYYRQEFAVAIVFALMAVVLIVRPRGLFGQER